MSCNLDDAAYVWNFQLNESQRAKVLRSSDYVMAELDLDSRAINQASEYGWSKMLDWIGADNDAVEAICSSIARHFS